MSKREVFIKVFQESRRSLTEAEKATRDAARDFQLLKDMGDCTEGLVDGMPGENVLSAKEWDELTGTWRRVLDQTQSFEKQMRSSVGSLSAVTSGTGLTMTSVFQVAIVSPAEYDRSVLKESMEGLYRLFEKDTLGADVKR